MKRVFSVLAVLFVLCAIPAVANDIRFARSMALNPTFTYTTDLDTGDVDGDGDLDVLFINTFAINDGRGNFTSRPHPPCGRLFRLVDVDGDGDLDIAGVYGNQLSVLLNDGAASFTSLPIQLGSRTNIYDMEMVVADITGDGAPDLVNNAGCLFVNHGGGTFVDETTQRGLNIGSRDDRTDVAVLDANRDGLLDLLFPMTGVQGHALYIQRPGGTFVDETAARFPELSGWTPFFDALDVQDMNGDGAMDIVTNGYGGLKVFVNNGAGIFVDRVRTFFSCNCIPEAYPGAWGLRDLNFDGRRDLVMLGQTPRIYPGGTSAPFIMDYTSPVALDGATSYFSSVIHIADLNGDGWDDLLFRTSIGSAATVFYYVNQMEFSQTSARTVLTADLDLALETAYSLPPELGEATYTWSLTRAGDAVPAYLLSGKNAPLDGSATAFPAGAKVNPGMYQAALEVEDPQGRTLARASLALAVPRDYYAEFLECGTDRQVLQEALAAAEAERAALAAQLSACDTERDALVLDAALTQAGLQEIRRLAALPPGQRRSTFVPQGSQAAVLAEVIGLLLNGSH